METLAPDGSHSFTAHRGHRLGHIPTSTFQHLIALTQEGQDPDKLHAWLDLVLYHCMFMQSRLYVR